MLQNKYILPDVKLDGCITDGVSANDILEDTSPGAGAVGEGVITAVKDSNKLLLVFSYPKKDWMSLVQQIFEY